MPTPRRYQEYLRQGAGNSILPGSEAACRGARDAIAGTPIPATFPASAKLLTAYGPTACIEDLPEYGFDDQPMAPDPTADARAELARSGLNATEITAVLRARGWPGI